MPNTGRNDNELFFGKEYSLLTAALQQDDGCCSLKRKDNFIAALVTLPFAASRVVTNVHCAVTVGRDLSECFGGLAAKRHFRGSISQVFQTGQQLRE